jgi:hypothetical protein
MKNVGENSSSISSFSYLRLMGCYLKKNLQYAKEKRENQHRAFFSVLYNRK